ncbi:MAG TPA: hypothetical protein VK324_00035, partial [Tepidisphaeraceae bacterium]|nr:hypothetical protein [Tepidisphaeraceae bacterium]
MSGRKSVPVQVAIRSAVAEALESRRLLTATFWVTSAAASGPGSFADVIGVANANPGPDTIAFNINGGGPALIQMTAGLPTITDPVTIDGTTQPGYAGTPLVHLRGDTTSVLAGGDRGLHFASTAGGSVVHGLRMSNWWQAISGAADLTPAPVTVVANHITGNWFGVYTGAQWTVGGTTPAARNVIAGNQYGIRLLANSVVQGNYIGTDPSGTMAHANVYGVELHGNNATIGGTTAEARNVISGNTVGISGLASGTSLLARVLGNYIGTDATGAAPLGNGVGIDLRSSFTAGTDIGANVPGGGNVIAYNSGAGVRLLPTGDTRIIGNSIFANGGLEIDVSPDGVNAAAYGA